MDYTMECDPLTLTLAEVKLSSECIDLNGPSASITTDLSHYCVVRADLTTGQQAAHLLHAAGESWALSRLPYCAETRGVALHARDEAHLVELEQKLQAAGLGFHTVVDGQKTAIGLYPTADVETVRRILSSLPLVR